MRLTSVAIAFWIAQPLVAGASNVCRLELEGEPTNRTVRLEWPTQHGKHYSVETTPSLTNEWATVDNCSNIEAHDYVSQVTIGNTNSAAFYRVQEIDGAGPSFTFNSPAMNEIGVSASSAISVSVEDPSGIDRDSVVLIIDGVQVASSNLVWQGTTFTYVPEDGLGRPGQELSIFVSARDVLGNPAMSAESKVVIECPPALSQESFLVLGDPGLETFSYKSVNGEYVGCTGIVVSACSSNALTLCGVSDSDLSEGLLCASAIPTNGFYRRIVSFERSASGVYDVKTVDATLSDFIVGTVTTNNLASLEYGADGRPAGGVARLQANGIRDARLLSGARAGGEGFSRGFSKTVSFALPRPFVTLGPFKYTTGDTAFSATFNGRVAFQGNVTKGKDDRYDIVVDGQVVLNEYAALSPEVEFSLTEKIGESNWPLFTAMTPTPVPVPIVISIKTRHMIGAVVSGSLAVDVDGEGADVPFDVTQIGSLRLHVQKRGGKWSLADDTGIKFGAFSDNTHAQAFNWCGSAEFSIQNRFTLAFDNLVGLYLTADPYVSVNRENGRLTNGKSTERTWIECGVKSEVGIEAGWIGVATVGITFAKGNPVKVLLWEHYEDSFPARILSCDERIEAVPGEHVYISALAQGNPPVEASWHRKGRKIADGIGLDFVASESTEGEYTLLVSNAYGSDRRTANVVLCKNEASKFVGTWVYNTNEPSGTYEERYPSYLRDEYERQSQTTRAQTRIKLNADMTYSYMQTAVSKSERYSHILIWDADGTLSHWSYLNETGNSSVLWTSTGTWRVNARSPESSFDLTGVFHYRYDSEYTSRRDTTENGVEEKTDPWTDEQVSECGDNCQYAPKVIDTRHWQREQ